MPLSQPCCEGESLADVRLFEIWEVGEKLGDGSARRECLDDHTDRYAHTADARFAAHDFGVEGDTAELLHRVMIALERTRALQCIGQCVT